MIGLNSEFETGRRFCYISKKVRTKCSLTAYWSDPALGNALYDSLFFSDMQQWLPSEKIAPYGCCVKRSFTAWQPRIKSLKVALPRSKSPKVAIICSVIRLGYSICCRTVRIFWARGVGVCSQGLHSLAVTAPPPSPLRRSWRYPKQR
jgi:hypothetical protein